MRIEDHEQLVSKTLGQAVLDVIYTHMEDPLNNPEQLMSYTVTKNSLGQLVISPRIPGKVVTWLNGRLKQKFVLGKVLQKDNFTIFDPMQEAWVGPGKTSKDKKRRRQ